MLSTSGTHFLFVPLPWVQGPTANPVERLWRSDRMRTAKPSSKISSMNLILTPPTHVERLWRSDRMRPVAGIFNTLASLNSLAPQESVQALSPLAWVRVYLR
ncbi:MAG: hypothetical protein LUC44_03370 [Prevotellaceae bacterium]|nr:hypothetical protein [Prevotellaceae bacterium]